MSDPNVGTSMELAQEDPGGPLRKPPETTTLSTIAVRSGSTRIVIALLQSRHQLELKVLEVEPALTLLGNTLDEASHLLDTQNEVIRQIESKHSPVEELLRKADSLITNPSQRPIRPEVYAAMAESLGVAWRDVNAYLTRRRSILERNVNYHSEASKCYDCMSRLEATCTSALPTNPTSLQELTSRVRDLRRSMLESLMAALGQGKYLLDILKEVAREATAENIRISALAAISQVEHWLENLHDRRKMLEILWQSRKAKLNKYKIIIELREELSQLEYQVEELNRMIHMEEFTSGQCVSSAQKLYRQNEGYLIAAKEVQEKLIRFLKTLEDSADLKSKAYLLLQQCAELIHETETRAELWIKVMHFFSSSHAVIEKLKALQRDNAYNEEVKNWTPVLDEICGSVVLEGETLGIPIQNSEGIRVILQEIHQLRSSINSAWTRFQDSLIVRKLSSPAQPQAEPILARKYATLPSSMSRSQEYDREIRVEQFHRSLTPQHLTSPHAHQFQPIIQPHHELMSRSFDLGYSSFDQSSSPRQEWQRRVGPPLNRSSDPLNRSSDRLNGISDPLNRSSDRLNGISDPLNRSSDRLNRISDPLSRSRDFNHVDKPLSRSQEQLKIAEIRRALSPSVEDFENYIRNAYASPISPIDLEQAECRYTVETEVRRQLIVEHELRMGEQIEGSLEKESLARETQRRLEMIRENEILRKQEVEKIRNLEKLKQIELRKLEKLKQQRKYEEELLRIKDETEAEAKEKERIEIEARKEEERIALEIEAKEKSEAEEKARAKEIEARKLKLKQIGVEKQKAREEKIRSEMEYEREKELERKKEKERLLEAEKQLQREEEIKLRGDEEERERKRRETKLLAEIEEQQRVEELKQREREESKQRELEEERERKRREDLERLKDLEQELRRKHELQIKRESEERERIENERLQKEVEAKLERERREKEFEEQLIQEEIRRKKEIEAREKLLEQQRALDKALEEERTRKMKEMEEKLEEERKRKQREAEEQMEIERKLKEKEIQDRIEQERLRKEREAEEKIEQEKLRKQKEMQEKLEEERRQKEKELQDQLEKERIRKKREAEEELEREKRRKQKELEDKLEDERRQRMRETEELLERERRQKEREMQEELERERLRKQKETEEKLEQERIRKEKELQDRLEKERKQREAEEQKEIERKRREKEMEEQIEREREALKQKALEEERKHQEELERIKKEQELLEQERKRNEEMIQKEKEELRKQKEQELRKQIEELKEIGREKERQRLRDLEVIAQLEEERKCQKLKEEQGRALEEVRRQSQSPKSPTRTHTEHSTFVSKIPQPTSPLKKSPSPVQTSSGIPEDKLNQHSITEVNTGRLYTTKPLKRFLECYQHVLSWLTTNVEAFVNGHQDMGSGLALARQFYDLHVQYLQDLEERKEDISSIIQHIPSNIKPDARADMDRKLSNLNDKYSRLYSTIHTRLKLSKHYVSIHELSVNLSIEYDLLDLLLGKRQQQDQLIDDKLEKLNQMRSLFRNVCTRFFKLVEKIGDSDTYLDIERTRTCIDTLLDHFDNRNLNIDSKYHSYQIQISKLQDTKIRLMQNMADSNKTVDWVSKLDAQLYPILSDDLSSSQDVLNHIADKYRVVLPEIRRALAEIKLRIKTAEDLLGQGQGEGVENLGEGVPPRLKELDEKLSSIVTDYQAMLEVYQTFFQNFLQLEKNISEMTHEVNQTGQEAANVPDMENMLEQHEMSKQTARELFKYVHAESIQVVNKIKELEPDQGAEKDVSIVNRILNSKRKQLDHLYTNQEYDLESKKHLIQFDADLKSIHSNLDELTSQLSAIQDKYTGDNGVQAASLELHYFEKTLQLLAERIETFVTGADSIMKLETDTSHIETQIHKLKFKWNELQNQVKHTKNMVDASAQYVAKVDEVSEFCKQNRQFLSTVTMKSHLVKSPQDAEKLLDEIEQYLRPKETQLNETLLELQQLASHSTGGDIETKINQIKNDRAELNECFASLKQELQELANQKPDQQEPTNESATPEPSQPGTVHNIPITREDTPEIAETKPEGVRSPIFEEARTDSPKPGPAHSVHIEEIESIRGESPALVSPEDIVPVAKAPVFVEPLRNSVVEEGAKFTFRCKVSGFPTPEISWLKDGISIKNNLDYQTSYFDGLCTLTIDETFAEDSAKFTCTAKNSSGVAETSAFLSITECEPGEQITPPQFSLKLQDVKFSPGSTPIQLLCRVSSNPLPTIKWLKDGVDCLAGEEEGRHYRTSYRDGVAVLEILEPSRETPGVYECQATNRLGTEISSAKVELDGALPEPKFLVPLPHEAMVRAGQKLKLQCEVEHLDSSDDTRVTWLYNGKPVTDNSRDVKTFSEDTNLTLLISEAFPKDAGTYSVSIESPAGSITSSCNVSVKGLLPSETSDTEAAENVEPVKPSISSPLRDVSLFEGAQVLLDCVIVGSPEPEVIWYHNGRPVKESGDFQLLFKGDKCSLLIKEAFVEDGGEYKVVAINSAGEASSSCNLTVQVISQQNEPVATRQSKVATPAAPTEEEYTLPKFTQLLTDVLVREGDNVLLESCVEGNPTPSVKWTLNNKDIVYNDRVKSEFNPEDGKATLSISNATQQDRGLYTVRADNSLGESKCFSHVIVKSVNTLDSASSEIYLSDVFEVPEFTETFADVSIPEETAVKFECIAVGKPTPKIKWLFNEEPISGKDFLISTSGARQVCSIPTAPMYLSGGRITCVAENEAGRATCTAQLTVTRSSTESLIPILTPTMSVAQLEPSGKQYEMKRSAMFSSASSFSSRVNGGQAAPQSEVTSFSSEKHETSQQTGAQPTVHSESEHIKEYKNINGVETRNEKSTESSSANFGELISKHEILSSGGSYGSIPALAKSTSNSSITKSGPRKPVAPRFISPLNGKIVDLGADVLLEAIIEGHPTPDVKWSKNGAPLDSIPGKITLTFEHNKARLELKNATTEDGGRYTCTLDNPTGSAGSTADLIVKKSIFPPVMCRRLLPQFIYVGDRLVMEVEIAGTPTPTVKWFKDNIPIAPHSQEYRLRQQGNSYAVIVEKATQSNSGTYKVTATNEGGEALSSADVKVTEKSALTTTPALLTFSQPSSLQTENKLEQRDFTNSSTFFKQQQQQVQQHQQPLQQQQQQQNLSSYSTQENLSVSKTLLKEDKNVNLKVANEFMPLNMPYSIQSSGTETHKETVIPIQTDNKTYIENQKTESTTQVVNSDEAAKEGIEHTTIPKKCALDFFKNIIKENESEQNFLKETEKQLPPSFHTDKKKEIHHHVEKTESLLSNQYQPGPTSPVFPHSDDQIPPEFARNILNERVETKSFEKSWKPVSPVPQPYNDTPLYLEPGPPPEICYVPKVAPKTKENFTERIKKMEESHRELSTAEVPQGGIKIFPKQQAEPVYKAPEPARPPPFKPAYDHKPVVEERCIKTQVESSGQSDYTFGRKVISPPTNGPVLRPQADIHVRPTSPRPSAEGVSMEKLWTTKLHKESEITRPASPLARPPSPKHNIINETRETSHTEIKRCISPRPSAEGLKMDKMWAHPATNHTPHPTSLMPAIPVPVKKDDEDEEAKRLAWSRKYLTEDEVTTRTVKKTVIESPPPVYNPPTPAPAPVYRPPAPAPAPAYHPPAPAPVYNPPVAKQPPPPTPKPAYVATPPPPYKAPVHHVSPPHQQLKQQSSFDQTSSYKQSSFQSNQKASPPWVKSEPSQNVVTPPWVKPSPPSTPSHSTINKTFSSSEDRSYSSSTQQKPIQFKPNTYTPPYQPKPVANQYYKTESQENETKQFRAPNYSPYSSQNSNQSNSSVVQQSFSSQTVRESYQSGGNQFSSSQQQPVSFSESAVVEEHHLKPSLAKKVWPLVQNSSSSYTPVVPSFSSEPVTESSYSYEVAKTDNGYVEKEIKTQRTVQREEKQFSYPPPARSSLQSKIAAFEEKNYQSDYDSKFDSSDSEIRRTGSLKRPERPSSAAGYGTLPKTFGRSNSFSKVDYQSSHTQRFNQDTSDVIPGLKPGSPPQILHASQFYSHQEPKVKRKGYTQGDSGYMADTEESFQSKMSQDGSIVSSAQKKSMLIASHAQPSSPRHKSFEQSARTETYSKSQRKHCPPPRNPSKFVRGEFRESDYESDYESKIKPKWRPYDSDTEEITYRPVRPNLSAPKRRSLHLSQPVACPLEFDKPPVITDMRPVPVQHIVNPSGAKTSNFSKSVQVKRNDFVCPPPPPNQYHSVQNFEPKVFEDTQSMSQSESGENFHRSMNVQQSTRIMTSNGLVDGDSLLDAEKRRLQRVEEMKRRFEDKTVMEAKHSTGGELFSAPHIPSVGTTSFSSVSSAQQVSQSYHSTSSSSEQYFNSAQHQLTNGIPASQNFKPENFGSPRKEKVITLTDSCFDPEPPRRLPIFITPLRDIAVVSGGVARFECIVQADPAPSVTWSKDGQVLHPSHQHQIEFRNGVCRLTLPHAYPFDAGTYSCSAVNAVGTVETSASLTVPGEKRSFNL